MNKEDRQWLEKEFVKYMGLTLKGETLEAFYKAEMLLGGWEEIRRRKCSCEYRKLKSSVENSYSRWANG